MTGTFAQLPAFDLQPHSVTNAVGSTVSFSAHAVGNAPLGYRWFFSGGSLTHATNTTLTLTNVLSGQAGNYWVIATNNYGRATSSVVLLTLTNSSWSTNVVYSPDEGSLRAAIKIGGWVSLAFNGTVTITNTINITNKVILDGKNVSATISGGNAVRLFYVAPGATFYATNLTLANGSCIVTNGTPGTPADAGAIYNNGGTVSLVACTLTNNNAQSLIAGGLARGGAIFNNGGTVSLCQSAILNNAAMGGYTNGSYGTALGGVFFNTNGSIAITSCNLSSNFCEGFAPSGTGLTMGGAAYQASGSLNITNSLFASNLALGGNGMGMSAPSGSPAYGGVLAANGGSVTINYSQLFANTARGGDAGYHGSGASAFGGAVYSTATLTVNDSSFFGNQTIAGSSVDYHASGLINGFGGAIYNSGSAVLNRCSIYSNYVQGGGVESYSGEATTGFSGLGGGIFNALQFAATNCTIALNTAAGGGGIGQSISMGTNGNAIGGGVFNNTNATFSAMNLTIASNSCSSPAGLYFTNGIAAGTQIANTNGTLRSHNSLIAYGGANGNAYGTITDDGYNICSDGTAQLFSGSSYNFTDPLLGPLANYGGPTLSMALLPDSPAIDSGDSVDFPSTDQRGFVRPFGEGPDMGAYEYQSDQVQSLSITSLSNSVVVTFTGYPASPPVTYILQASADLSTWTDISTNGPFDDSTNISQTISNQGSALEFFRLLILQ